MNILRDHLLLLALLAALCACSRASSDLSGYEPVYTPAHATGFDLLGCGGNTLIVTRSPWQGTDSATAAMLLIDRDGTGAPEGFAGSVMPGEARRIVCMSSTHVAMLDALGLSDRIVGVSGLDYISSGAVQARRADIADVGFDSNIDYELLHSLRPDLVMLYGVAGASPMEPHLRQAGIPYMYVGDYLEQNPLGRAEWVVAIGEAAGARAEAESVFAPMPARYDSLRALAAAAPERPAVMLNTPYADQWFMASTDSYMARLIADAGGRYVYTQSNDGRSVPIDLEQAYLMTAEADVWLNTGQSDRLADLRERFPKFADTPPVAAGRVWNCTRRTNAAGANDFWESGAVHPDLVLRDLINILHPQLLADSTMVYYRRLD